MHQAFYVFSGKDWIEEDADKEEHSIEGPPQW